MEVHRLLLRGMLVGLVAALVAFGFARAFGEPSVDRAITFEDAMHEKAAAAAKVDHPVVDQPMTGQPMAGHSMAGHAMGDDDPDIFSRSTQAGIGLFTAVTVVGTAVGGLFALLFAFCYGRVSHLSPKALAAVLGLVCFVTVYLVPDLKYPANPPSVGEPSTIGIRTGLYFSMIAISVIATIAGFSLRRVLVERLGPWNAALCGTAAFVALIAVAQVALPVVNEVPEGFPAQVLWNFRVASLGIQLILWGGIGLLFGALTERALSRTPPRGALTRG